MGAQLKKGKQQGAFPPKGGRGSF